MRYYNIHNNPTVGSDAPYVEKFNIFFIVNVKIRKIRNSVRDKRQTILLPTLDNDMSAYFNFLALPSCDIKRWLNKKLQLLLYALK